MQSTEILEHATVHLGVAVSDKPALLKRLAALASARCEILPDVVLDALAAREALGSTGVGGGVALPHARLPGLTAPLITLLSLARPLSFEAVDEKPVVLVGCVLSPAGNEQSIGVLACLARAFRDGDLVRRLSEASTPEAFLDLMRASAH